MFMSAADGNDNQEIYNPNGISITHALHLSLWHLLNFFVVYIWTKDEGREGCMQCVVQKPVAIKEGKSI